MKALILNCSSIPPGVETEMGEGDEWPAIHDRILDSEIVVFATPTWVGGNDDGAHHVISEISGALGDIGFTIPGQAWAYWNMARGHARTTPNPKRATSGRRRPVRRRPPTSSPSPPPLAANPVPGPPSE
jgi:hypothetical protein